MGKRTHNGKASQRYRGADHRLEQEHDIHGHKKLEAKGFIKRDEPNFCLASSLVSRDEVRREETHSLIDKLFGGSKKALLSSLLEDEKLSEDELTELRKMIDGR